jgi:hypothetical protein
MLNSGLDVVARQQQNDAVLREVEYDRSGKGGIAILAILSQLYQRMICEVSTRLAQRHLLPWGIQPACAE